VTWRSRSGRHTNSNNRVGQEDHLAALEYQHMIPPEVVLDRYVRIKFQQELGFSGYLGKLDIDRVEPAPLREFLDHIQRMMNDELLSEGVNESGSVKHPPFHFDYIEVDNGVAPNAYAFQHDGYAFIAITRTMMESLGNLSKRLSRSETVVRLLSLDIGVDADELQELLFHILLYFLVSHEYTHHIHRHGETGPNAATALWTEFQFDATDGSITSQAQELDADGYATYLVLAHVLRGGARAAVLAQLGQEELSASAGDELLLQLFFLAAFAFFCEFWRGGTDMKLIRQFTHPPPPVRITYIIRTAQMWCGQDQCVSETWFDDQRFQKLFRASFESTGEANFKTWASDMSFIRSAEGEKYDNELFQAFDTLRRGLSTGTQEVLFNFL
jgi:hypothetical protein